MTENSKRFAWVNIWMMAFAVIGIWLVYPNWHASAWFDTIRVAVPLMIVLLVGFLNMQKSLQHESGKHRWPNLEDTALLYVQAWKELWSHRWLVRVFGAVLALILLAVLANMAMQPARPADRMGTPAGLEGIRMVFSMPIAGPAIASSIGDFLPGIGGIGAGTAGVPILALALIAFTVYLAIYSKRLIDDSECSRQAGFLRSLAAPLVMMLAAVAVGTPIAWTRFVAGFDRAGSGYGQPPSGWMLHLVLGLGSWLVVFLLTAFVVSGVLGSLARAKRNEVVTLDTFLRDVIRYSGPIAGFYLLFAVLGIVFLPLMSSPGGMSAGLANVTMALAGAIQWLTVLLMFVPSAIVLRDIGAFQGIRSGLRDWLSHWAEALSFVALGITFISVVDALKEIPSNVLRLYSNPQVFGWELLGYVNAAMLMTVRLLVTAFMMVAVWEFYWRISRSSAQE